MNLRMIPFIPCTVCGRKYLTSMSIIALLGSSRGRVGGRGGYPLTVVAVYVTLYRSYLFTWASMLNWHMKA